MEVINKKVSWRDQMKKLIALVMLSAALTVTGGLSQFDAKSVSAAPVFQKINFVNGVVTATQLNVRQGASANFPVVCVLKKGQQVKIFGKVGDWYAVYEPMKGCVGAAHSAYIKTADGAAAPAPNSAPKPAAPAPKPPAPAPKPSVAPAPLPPGPAASSAPATGVQVSQDEQRILDLVNQARASAGVSPLKFDAGLLKTARLKAKDMVDNNYFSHQSPTYGSPFDMMRQFGISFNYAGENIAGNQTADAAFQAWMQSEGHRKNILNGNFNYIGIGVAPSPTYGKVFVQQFIGR